MHQDITIVLADYEIIFRLILTLTTSIALLIGSVSFNPHDSIVSTTTAQASQSQIMAAQNAAAFVAMVAEPVEKPAKSIVSVEQYVRTYYADTPILIKIAKCESRYRQFGPDNAVLRGTIVPSDTGVMQINEYYHDERASKLGFDLHTLDGNLAFGKYLYEKEGTTPWNSSKACWDK